MTSYPLHIKLENKEAVVIGGGKIAERKINSLLHAGAKVTVVSPALTANLEKIANDKILIWKKMLFHPKHVQTAFIVIAAANDKKVNALVANSVSHQQLINVVDQPELGNFHVPSVLKRGKLTITVSTEGASPLLAKKIKNELSTLYDDSYESYLEFLFECRHKIKSFIQDSAYKQQLLKELLEEKYKNSSEERAAFLMKLQNK
ncbi:NAD(P)-binding protein [Bacillus taeanensis]|nr:NAD(P)-binding protein [Bacillus taeanensis]